jgi:hypothetical protein
MILLILMTFAIATAVISAWLIVSPRKAAAVSAGVAFFVPYVSLLYVGHRVVDITLLDMILMALGSAALAGLLKSLRHRTG